MSGDVINIDGHQRGAPPAGRRKAQRKPADSRYVAIAETIKNDFVLATCTAWRVERALQIAEWARREDADGWGNLPSVDLPEHDLTHRDLMLVLQDRLARFEPKTVLGAREMLGVVIEILAHQPINPEWCLSKGPLLEIVRNVMHGLDNLPSLMPLARKRRKAVQS